MGRGNLLKGPTGFKDGLHSPRRNGFFQGAKESGGGTFLQRACAKEQPGADDLKLTRRKELEYAKLKKAEGSCMANVLQALEGRVLR